jgi:hypothetical protein
LQKEQGQKNSEGQRQQQQQTRQRIPTTIEIKIAIITGKLKEKKYGQCLDYKKLSFKLTINL